VFSLPGKIRDRGVPVIDVDRVAIGFLLGHGIMDTQQEQSEKKYIFHAVNKLWYGGSLNPIISKIRNSI
jgi:hypothetical protein